MSSYDRSLDVSATFLASRMMRAHFMALGSTTKNNHWLRMVVWGKSYDNGDSEITVVFNRLFINRFAAELSKFN